MRYILSTAALLLCLGFTGPLFAQKKEFKKARERYEVEDWYNCTKYYDNAKEMGATLDLDDQKKLARCYLELNKIGPAYDIYNEIADNLTKEELYYYARVQQRFGLFEDAIDWYDKAKKSGALPVSVIQVNDMIESCRWALANQGGNPTVLVNPNFTLASMGQSFGVQFYKDKVVYSSVDKNTSKENKKVDAFGNPFLNLFMSDVVEDRVVDGTQKSFSANLESPFHVGAISFTSDQKHMFYTKTDDQEGITIQVVDEVNGEWLNARDLEFCKGHHEYLIAHPAVSPDNKYLYFVGKIEDHTAIYGKDVRNYGGMDIYRAEFGDGFDTFKQVENLGPEINTYGNECYPVFNPDGHLYFSSDTRKGFGGLDIFCADYIDGKWQNARNMLKPYNSTADDFCYVQFPDNREKGFLSSSNYGNQDADVIFNVSKMEITQSEAVELPPVFGAEGLDLTSAPTQIDLEQKAQVIEEEQDLTFETTVLSTYYNQVIPEALVVLKEEESDAVIARSMSDEAGRVSFSFSPSYLSGGKEIMIAVSRDGYNDKELQANQAELAELAQDGIRLTPVFKDEVLDDLSGMVIPYVAERFPAASIEILDKLAAYLVQQPGVTVKLNAHTEAKGNRYGNLDVSQRMAEKAKQYCISKGAKPEQMIPRGYGERYLKNRCHRGVYCTPDQHALNRRIEVVVWHADR